MKVLVTGGTGYVGSALREKLKEQGHEVRLLIRKGSEDKVNNAHEYGIVTGDILNNGACMRACDGVDAVVHLVGIIREFPRKGITFNALHTSATLCIVNAAKRMGVERFIHMSALGSRKNASSAYHRTKYEAEQIVRRAPLRWTIFRPSVVFEIGSEFLQTLIELVRKRFVPLIDGGRSRMQPVALSDVCTCMSRAIAMPETQGRIFELGGPDQLTFREMVVAVASALDIKIHTLTVPAWMVRPVVKVMERNPSFPLTSDQLVMLREDNVSKTQWETDAFGIQPTSFIQALPGLMGE